MLPLFCMTLFDFLFLSSVSEPWQVPRLCPRQRVVVFLSWLHGFKNDDTEVFLVGRVVAHSIGLLNKLCGFRSLRVCKGLGESLVDRHLQELRQVRMAAWGESHKKSN